MIPYGHQSISSGDVEEMVKILQSDWLTQGPKIEEFEKKIADYCGAKYAVVMNSGTAALHAAYFAADFKQGDEFITSAMTFVATSNAGLWQGARPIFVDIDQETGNIDSDKIEAAITSRTRAIVPIDYAGRPADFKKIKTIAEKYNLLVIEDGCHALGASYFGTKIGNVSDMTIFSFHPVKGITTGEGGAVLTNNEAWYKKMKMFITHGITKNDFINNSTGAWYFEMQGLGQNYRLTDFQCALGISQLKRLDSLIEKRHAIMRRYNEGLKNIPTLTLPPEDSADVFSAWHLYVVNLKSVFANKRAEVFAKLREANIGVQVHYIPVYMHPYYRRNGYANTSLPITEQFYNTCLSLPIFPDLSEFDQAEVISTLKLIIS